MAPVHTEHRAWSRADDRGQGWRAWLMTDEEGDPIGWYPTEQEAKKALLDKALSLLMADVMEGDGG